MNYSRTTAIHMAMLTERPSTRIDEDILSLIEKGCDVNAVFHRRETPLHYAVCRPSANVAHKLIKNGANINAQDENGCSPLHEAVYTNNTESICMLLYYGADVNLLNSNQHTPFVQGIEKCMCVHNLQTACWLLNHYDKLRGRFTNMENYLNLFRNPIDQPLDETKKLWLITQIWGKLDHDTMLRSKSMFLSSYILESRFSTPQWLKGLYSMLDSADVAAPIGYTFNILDVFKISHFSALFSAFQARNVSRKDRAALFALWLGFGAQVSVHDVLEVHFRYGMNQEMMVLIFATPVPLLTLLFGLEGLYGAGQDLQDVLLYGFICNVRQEGVLEMVAGFICGALLYFSWDGLKRTAIASHCEDERILRALEKTPMVASLVEKCRDVVVRVVQRNILRGRGKSCGSAEFHAAVGGLEVTRDVRDILNFKRPLYMLSN